MNGIIASLRMNQNPVVCWFARLHSTRREIKPDRIHEFVNSRVTYMIGASKFNPEVDVEYQQRDVTVVHQIASSVDWNRDGEGGEAF
jgi:hypothetical protein